MFEKDTYQRTLFILSLLLYAASPPDAVRAANQAPSVNLIAPVSGTILTGPAAGVIISATASDPDGSVTNLEFFDGLTLVGAIPSAPFSVRASLDLGTHLLTARATDNNGASTSSGAVQVAIVEPSLLTITTFRPQGGDVEMRWSGGSGPFAVQRTGNLADQWCSLLPAGMGHSALMPRSGLSEFFRIADLVTSSVPLAVFLDGAAVQPSPIVTGAGGAGTLLLAGNTISFEIAYTNLSSPATGCHLCGPAGPFQSSGVLVDLAPTDGGAFGTGGRLTGSVVVTPAEKTAVLSGVTYIQFDTPTHPGGEIRGQVTPDLTALEAGAVPAFKDLQISFRLDPWLIGGSYGGGFWVSPPSLGPVTQGATFTIETRADGLADSNTVAANATWTPADPQMVAVSVEEARQVTITVLRAGQTTVEVTCQGARKSLSITATNYLGTALQVVMAQ
jgi:CHRD domain-containing protein/Big-like domain-containing protein